ncbi:MAG TPA: hypothetical protein VFU77_05925 [Steroidobacteraceae bacterium]|nr:hypothetical protein [Steroidobacteraceae bacterium]
MNSGFTLEPREGYLYVHLAPGFEMTPESKVQVWTAICDACRERGFLRVLAEGDNVKRRVGPMDSFGIADLVSRLLPGLSVACCFRGFVPDEQTQFFRTAAMNRGMRAEFFQDLSAALRWLGAGDPSPG